MTELLPTQADRDAAWPFYETTIDWPATHEFKANWMAGGMDHSRIIQAFARHAAEARLSTEAAIVAWLREQFEAKRYGPGYDDYDPGADMYDVIADAIEQGKCRG